MQRKIHTLLIIAGGLLTAYGCSSDDGAPATPEIREGACLAPQGQATEFLLSIQCRADFDALASEPLDASLPGARSVKVVLDQDDGDALYFQNSTLYPIHYQFASKHLSGGTRPPVPLLAQFNEVEYYKPERRFILGAVTYYENPDAWTFELAPYDTADAAMITKIMSKLRGAAYFGPALVFHPSSRALELVAKNLAGIKVVSTDDLYRQTDYQPLALGTSIGRLHRLKSAQLATDYVSYRDIVVLDQAPNDISVVAGIITEEFQTPLSHVNILSQNRGTPNMGLRNASTDPRLAALDGKWVELTVAPTQWSVREVTQAEADAYFEAHRPPAVTLPQADLAVTGLWDIENVVPEVSGTSLRDAIKKAVLAFGGKSAHYSILAKTEDVPSRKAFAVPIYYYDQFMRENGFYAQIDAMLKDAAFMADPKLRDTRLADLRLRMMQAPVNQGFQDLLRTKIAAEYPGGSMRFRTSTNSEDLLGFPCAGCYESHTGNPANWNDVLDAIRETWASIWLFRTFEERSYYGIAHNGVGMGLLVHHNFPDEEANGVAVTGNPFDASGLEPGFYVNVQWGGDAEVVHPPPGVSSDEFLYFFSSPNQPITFLSHSNLVEDGSTVLSARQTYNLGLALQAIHERFAPAYRPASGGDFYAMDVEFKFDGAPGQEPTLFIKQARPYKGRGQAATAAVAGAVSN